MTMGPAPIIIIFLMSVRLLELVALSQARKTGDSSASAMARIEPPRMGRVTFLRLAWVVTRALAGTPSVFARAAADAIFLLQFKLEEVVVGKGKKSADTNLLGSAWLEKYESGGGIRHTLSLRDVKRVQ